MITHDQILPSIYHLQRLGRSAAFATAPELGAARALAESPRLASISRLSFQAFPHAGRAARSRRFPRCSRR